MTSSLITALVFVVDTLAKLKSLSKLTMTQTQISPEGFKRLATALPNCSIRSN